MNVVIGIVVVGLLLLVIVLPLVYYTRRSSDIRLIGDRLEIKYPMRQQNIIINEELKRWSLQQATLFWIGKVYSVNLELHSGKWHHVNTRFNRESFDEIYEYLVRHYSDRRKMLD